VQCQALAFTRVVLSPPCWRQAGCKVHMVHVLFFLPFDGSLSFAPRRPLHAASSDAAELSQAPSLTHVALSPPSWRQAGFKVPKVQASSLASSPSLSTLPVENQKGVQSCQPGHEENNRDFANQMFETRSSLHPPLTCRLAAYALRQALFNGDCPCCARSSVILDFMPLPPSKPPSPPPRPSI
jgi:hypothetical protein